MTLQKWNSKEGPYRGLCVRERIGDSTTEFMNEKVNGVDLELWVPELSVL